jgi:hypothetical protein
LKKQKELEDKQKLMESEIKNQTAALSKGLEEEMAKV